MLYMCSLYVFALKRWLGSFPKADSHFVAQVSVCTVLVFGKVSLMETVLVTRVQWSRWSYVAQLSVG